MEVTADLNLSTATLLTGVLKDIARLVHLQNGFGSVFQAGF